MDRSPHPEVQEQVRSAAGSVPDVRFIEKLRIRRTGTTLQVEMHVQADPDMSLHDAHVVSGKVKRAIQAAVPRVDGVLIHMEPFEG